MYKQLTDMIEKLSEKAVLCGLFVLAAAERLIFMFNMVGFSGKVAIIGDSERYDAWARAIADQGLSYYANNLDKPYYWGYATVVAIFRAIFGFDYPLLIFQCLFSALSAVFIYKTAMLIFNSKPAALYSGIIYAMCHQTIYWCHVLYSDSIGLALEIICIYLFFLQKTQQKKQRVLTIVLLVICALMFMSIRTTSFITVAVLTAGLFSQLPKKPKKIIGLTVCAVIVGALIYMFANSKGEHGLASRLDYYIDLFKSGTIVYGGMDIDLPKSHFDSPVFALDIILVVLLRAVCFWGIALPFMEISEMIMNVINLVPLFILGFGGLIRAKKQKISGCVYFAALIIATNIVQALSEVDFAYRYRIPIYPALIIPAGWFLHGLLKKTDKKETESA